MPGRREGVHHQRAMGGDSWVEKSEIIGNPGPGRGNKDSAGETGLSKKAGDKCKSGKDNICSRGEGNKGRTAEKVGLLSQKKQRMGKRRNIVKGGNSRSPTWASRKLGKSKDWTNRTRNVEIG